MATQTATAVKSNAPVSMAINDENRSLLERLTERVARRAYELYEYGGGSDGNDLEHWLQAETELLGRVSEIRETGDEYLPDIPVDGFRMQDIYVGVDVSRAIVLAEKHETDGVLDAQESLTQQKAVFLAAKWPTLVHAETAKAQIRNGHLLLTVMRATHEQNGRLPAMRNPSLK